MEQESSTHKITPFKGEGFALWRYRVKNVLEDKGLWDTVTLEGMPIAGHEHRAAWDTRALKARRCITNLLADSQLIKVMHLDMPKEVLDTLASEFEAKSPANQLLLHHKFASCMMQSDISLTQHLHAFDALLLELKAGGFSISDQEAVLQLFMSLLTEYKMVSTALAVQPELSYANVR